jgi:glycosyltransferase involved in cell wall biosynthesis
MPHFKSLSIIIPAHKALRFIERSVESVLRNAPGSEIVIVENGSKDLSAKNFNSYRYPHISCHHLERGNKSIARNFGAQMAKRELVSFLDQDDEILPGIIRPIQILRDDAIDAVITTYAFSEEESEVPPYLARAKSSGAPMYHPMTIVTRPNVLFNVGGFDPTLSLAEDFDLISRLMTMRKNVILDPQPTLLRHFHDSNDSRNVVAARNELFEVLRRRAISDRIEGANQS